MKKTVRLILLTLPLVLTSCVHHHGHDHDHGHEHPPVHHWELPSRDPDRIVLTIPGDPATTAAVTWRTDISVEQGVLELAKETGAPRFDLDKTAHPAHVPETLSYEACQFHRAFSTHYHSVTLDGLEPDTLYCYRVGENDGFWSEWIQFRTASAEEKPLSFLYFGDAQNALLPYWSRLIRKAYETAPNANFALHAGDLINLPNNDTEWAEWFKAGGWIHAGIPVLPVAGNHEYTLGAQKFLSRHWRPQFTLPVETELPELLAETVYTVEYPNLMMIVLNSNKDPKMQVDWLRNTLEANTSRWIIVSFHHPIFSSGQGRDNKELRDAWKPLFDEFNVDLILQGHDHTYARGQTPQIPVQQTEQCDDSSDVQSVYINSVSGPKQYGFNTNEWDRFSAENVSLMRKGENTQFFQVINIDGNELVYQAYMTTGDLYDGFTLRKAADGTKTIEQMEQLPATRLFENTEAYQRKGL